LADHGEIGNGRKDESRGRISMSTNDRSNTYTLRRLARDNPKLLDKIEAGEAVSVSVITESIP
jgi:hypothetical protein